MCDDTGTEDNNDKENDGTTIKEDKGSNGTSTNNGSDKKITTNQSGEEGGGDISAESNKLSENPSSSRKVVLIGVLTVLMIISLGAMCVFCYKLKKNESAGHSTTHDEGEKEGEDVRDDSLGTETDEDEEGLSSIKLDQSSDSSAEMV